MPDRSHRQHMTAFLYSSVSNSKRYFDKKKHWNTVSDIKIWNNLHSQLREDDLSPHLPELKINPAQHSLVFEPANKPSFTYKWKTFLSFFRFLELRSPRFLSEAQTSPGSLPLDCVTSTYKSGCQCQGTRQFGTSTQTEQVIQKAHRKRMKLDRT